MSFSEDQTRTATRVATPTVIAVKPSLVGTVKHEIDAALHTVSNAGRRDSHIKRSDSFISKTVRFIKAPTYKYINDRWDKWVIKFTILSIALAVVMFIVWEAYGAPKLKYVTAEVAENTKDEYKGLNLYYDIQSYIRIGVSTAIFLATVMHLRILYKHNDFRNSEPPSNAMPAIANPTQIMPMDSIKE